ncbi:hypothetical protein [Vibrio coralliilyticus]|uniref:hypothetical protein n=1 Tax=Vibrio coralliilyticus TaxID=190893 RepID=UPI00178D46D7|nr:hypothetical protein [Vibrio coralliilyticus]NUW69914.1 hypothetical protein [Vibrio coralliilyticus]
MYQTLNKQRQLNDMRQRQTEIGELLKTAPAGAYRDGLQAESIEISRLIPKIENYVTDVDATAQAQAEEVEQAEAKIEANKEKTSKLLMTLLKKREQNMTDKANAKSKLAELEKKASGLATDPEAQAEVNVEIANHKAKMSRLDQVSSALDFNQKNAHQIAAGDMRMQVADPEAMAAIAAKQRAADNAQMKGSIAHDIALEALNDEQAKAEKEFFAEVDAYEA